MKILLPSFSLFNYLKGKMILVYRILFIPIFCVLLVKNFPKMLKRGGYGSHLKERLGFFPKLEVSKKKKRLWIQAVSVGEINAAAKLVQALGQKFDIVLTTTTTTGRKVIEKKLLKNIHFFGYFPWDFFLFSALAWKRIQPDAIILVEGELWPEHLHQAIKRKIPVFLINARLSDRSFKSYKKFPRFAKWIFGQVDYIAASSEIDASHISSLVKKEVVVSGNIKFDVDDEPLKALEKQELKKNLGFDVNSFVLLGNSTWPGEEALLLKIYRAIKNEDPEKDCRLLLVPRHAERRGEIINLIKAEKFSFWQRSHGNAENRVDICVGDTTGELSYLSKIADVAYIGKSLLPNSGGQSPMDAAVAGIPIVYGDKMTNFKDMCTSLEHDHAAIRAKNEKEVFDAIRRLVHDVQERELLSKNIKHWREKNCGATDFTFRYITQNIK